MGTTQRGRRHADTLQEAQVPIATDAYCAGAYSGFDAQTQICAGYPQGGVDTCQGDSGGPMFGRNAAGALRVVGATSFGEGCAGRTSPASTPASATRPARVDPLAVAQRRRLTEFSTAVVVLERPGPVPGL